MPADEAAPRHFETLCAEIEPQPESVTRPLTMPIVTAAVFQADSLETVHDLYGRTMGMLRGPLAALGVSTEFVDLTDTVAAERALALPAAVVVVESISNPLVRVPDLPVLAELAHGAGARLVVDNTFASPY